MANQKRTISSDPALSRTRLIVIYSVLIILTLFGFLILKFFLMLGVVWLMISIGAMVWLSASSKIRGLLNAHNIVFSDGTMEVDGTHNIALERIVAIEPLIHLRGLTGFKVVLRSDDYKLGKSFVFVVLDDVIKRRYGNEKRFLNKLMTHIEERRDVVEKFQEDMIERKMG